MADKVAFYVNGPARLLMACIIGDAFYPGAEKSIILLDQFNYNYDRFLSVARRDFDRILVFKNKERAYSHLGQFTGTYFRRYDTLKRFFQPNAHAILFGMRSPIQKFIIRYNKQLGNTVDIYAESIAVDRYFDPQSRQDNFAKGLLRRLLSEAFDYQHLYDNFFVHVPQLYEATPWFAKLRQMPNLYALPSAAKYTSALLGDVDMDRLAGFDSVLFGQPLSNFDNVLTHTDEEAILRRIVGDRRILVLPHPNERIQQYNKYAVLPGAHVLPAGTPNNLICNHVRPKTTFTYASTIAVEYAIFNPTSVNHFYPVLPRSHAVIRRYAAHVPNMLVSSDHVLPELAGRSVAPHLIQPRVQPSRR